MTFQVAPLLKGRKTSPINQKIKQHFSLHFSPFRFFSNLKGETKTYSLKTKTNRGKISGVEDLSGGPAPERSKNKPHKSGNKTTFFPGFSTFQVFDQPERRNSNLKGETAD